MNRKKKPSLTHIGVLAVAVGMLSEAPTVWAAEVTCGTNIPAYTKDAYNILATQNNYVDQTEDGSNTVGTLFENAVLASRNLPKYAGDSPPGANGSIPDAVQDTQVDEYLCYSYGCSYVDTEYYLDSIFLDSKLTPSTINSETQLTNYINGLKQSEAGRAPEDPNGYFWRPTPRLVLLTAFVGVSSTLINTATTNRVAIEQTFGCDIRSTYPGYQIQTGPETNLNPQVYLPPYCQTCATPIPAPVGYYEKFNINSLNVSDVTPDNQTVGAKVTFTGTHFRGDANGGSVTVVFNTATATTPTVNSDTSMDVVVPAGATSGRLTVQVAKVKKIVSGNYAVTQPAPSLTSISVTGASVGSTVTLTGKSLRTTSSVTINGVRATFSVISDSQISFVVPPGAITGQIKVTTDGGTTSSGTFVVPALAVSPADFNGDGKADIVWRNYDTGANTLWFMDGTTYTSSFSLNPVSDLNWKIVSANDFNGGGKADILWRNYKTGANLVWIMDRTRYVSSVSLPSVSDLNWKIVGAGDFNGDGKIDILWRNYSTGANTVWLMNGTSLVSNSAITSVSDRNWQIAGVGDFNRDGKDDILWRNYSTGANTVWLMNGLTYVSNPSIKAVSDLKWQIAGTGDLNQDGKEDIVWRNYSTGANSIWLMNGTTFSTSVGFQSITNLYWHP